MLNKKSSCPGILTSHKVQGPGQGLGWLGGKAKAKDLSFKAKARNFGLKAKVKAEA